MTNSFLDVNTAAFTVFARQLKLERDVRQLRFDRSTPGWRTTPPTWKEWGIKTTAVSEDNDQDKPAAVTQKETNKPVTDLIFDSLDILEALAPNSIANAKHYAKQVAPELKKRITVNNPAFSNTTAADNIELVNQEIKGFMFSRRHEPNQFHIVHLDITTLSRLVFSPFDSAIQCTANRGMVCVTANTKQVLEETGMTKFRVGADEAFLDELAVRLVLAQLERHANRNSRFTVPLMSFVNGNGTVNVYTRVYSGSLKEVNRSVLRIANVFQCTELDAHLVIPLSTESHKEGKQGKVGLSGVSSKDFTFSCEDKWTLASSQIWGYPVQNPAFVEECSVLNADGLFAQVKQELVDAPLLYSLPSLQQKYATGNELTLDSLAALLQQAGYQVSTNTKLQTFKTNANSQHVGEAVRTWLKQKQLPMQGGNASVRRFLINNNAEPEAKRHQPS